MRRRSRRRTLVIWSHSADPVDWYRSPSRTQVRRDRRVRRGIRLAGLLTLMGLMRVARGFRLRWCPLILGTVLTVAGIKLGDGWSVLIFGGLWSFAYSACGARLRPRPNP